MRTLGLLAAGLVLLAAGSAAAARPAGPTSRTTLYFLADGGAAPLGVRQTVAGRHPRAVGALAALLRGPTVAERRAGLSTAIPPNARLRSVRFTGRGGTGLIVDLAPLPPSTDVLVDLRVLVQLVRTVVGVGSVERVWLRSDGRPWGMPLLRGGVRSGPYDLTSFPWRVCVRGSCFQPLP